MCFVFVLSGGGFPGDSVVKNPHANGGDTGSIPVGKSPAVESSNPL